MAFGNGVSTFMARWIERGHCVLDVGANRGEYALQALDLTGECGQVHAFEPHADLAARLRGHAGNRSLRVVEKGVSDRIGTAEFYLDVRESCGAMASSLELLSDLQATGNVQATTISLTTIDQYCRTHGLSPHFIKIDVEGHEPSVFRGAVETINRCRPFLIFEFWESWWERGVREVFAYLDDHYLLVRVQDGAIVNNFYGHEAGGGIVDIGCIPIYRPTFSAMRPELLWSPQLAPERVARRPYVA